MPAQPRASGDPSVGPVSDREEVERIKTEFFELVSHELRTPLTSIVGYAELLQGDVDGAESVSEDERRRFVEAISANSRRLLRVVGDLLFVARMDSGNLELAHSDCDLSELAGESVDNAAGLTGEHDVNLVMAASDPCEVVGDPARLGQAIDALLSNAIKFSAQGGEVRVRIDCDEDEPGVEITDGGAGVPDGERDRVFERFYRGRTAAAEAIPGIGLGLTIARAIAEGHGGSISLEPVAAGGTQASLRLPRDPR